MEVGRRLANERLETGVQLKTPEDIAELVGHEMRGMQQEELWVLMVNSRNKYLGGGMSFIRAPRTPLRCA